MGGIHLHCNVFLLDICLEIRIIIYLFNQLSTSSQWAILERISLKSMQIFFLSALQLLTLSICPVEQLGAMQYLRWLLNLPICDLACNFEMNFFYRNLSSSSKCKFTNNNKKKVYTGTLSRRIRGKSFEFFDLCICLAPQYYQYTLTTSRFICFIIIRVHIAFLTILVVWIRNEV